MECKSDVMSLVVKYPIPNAEESKWENPLSSDDRESVRATDSTRLSALRDCRADDPQNHLVERRAIGGKRGYQYGDHYRR
jgi:hypothetical protein